MKKSSRKRQEGFLLEGLEEGLMQKKQVGKVARQKEEEKSEHGDGKAWTGSGKRKKSESQKHKAPGGHSRNMRLKRWLEPTGQIIPALLRGQSAPANICEQKWHVQNWTSWRPPWLSCVRRPGPGTVDGEEEGPGDQLGGQRGSRGWSRAGAVGMDSRGPPAGKATTMYVELSTMCLESTKAQNLSLRSLSMVGGGGGAVTPSSPCHVTQAYFRARVRVHIQQLKLHRVSHLFISSPKCFLCYIKFTFDRPWGSEGGAGRRGGGRICSRLTSGPSCKIMQ